MNCLRRMARWAPLFVIALCPPARAADLQVGVAAVDITPPVGFRMSGYFIERISKAVHDPLHAKAIVFVQGDTRAALVICDLVGIPRDVSERARVAIAAQAGIPVANVAVTATHTHTGPLYYGTMRNSLHDLAVAREGRDPCEPVDYPALLSEKITTAAVQAARAVRPMRLEAGKARQDPTLSFNRRYRMADGTVRSNTAEKPDLHRIVEPMGPVDPEVGIVLARDPASGQVAAGLTVFAMHQDTTGGNEFSADYAYYLERGLRERFGPSFCGLFGIGTCGNINHCDVSVEPARWRTAATIGPLLARTVLDAIPSLEPVGEPALAIRREVLEVPLQSYPPERVTRAAADVPRIGKGQLPFLQEVEAYKIVDLQLRRGTTARLEVQAFRLGPDVVIVAVPGEFFVEFGLAIKKASPFKTTLVMELANDNVSYVPTEQAFSEGGYETVNSRLRPGGGEMLTAAAISLLKQLGR
jgi:hypothetical protein